MKTFEVPNGMALSIFNNKYARKKEDGTHESWAEVAARVAEGNLSIVDDGSNKEISLDYLTRIIASGAAPTSGRHLQHGDSNQSSKLMESFVNCSTAMASFIKFWLLMKGSGVSRLYDSDICRVNWDNIPNVRLVLEGPDQWDMGGHPDYEDWIENARDARHKYASESEDVRWFTVADSAEGWVKVVEILETAAWQEKHRDKLFIFDFSQVRAKGTPIKGQQNRPASGPVPLIKALMQVASMKGSGMRPWKQAMFVDHYLAACVAVGGVRRAARLAAKTWRDRDIFDFIDIKRGGFLRSANNSVVLDEEFWEQANSPKPSHGRRVFEAMVSAGYFDGTGEPGFINAHLLSWNPEGIDQLNIHSLFDKNVASRLSLHNKTLDMLEYTLEIAKKKKYPFLHNPCGEIVLACWGAYCVISDICLANVENIPQAFIAGAEMAKFLIRANQMDTLYAQEVRRTNRIGVGLTGMHEFAYKHFGCTWQDLVTPTPRGEEFWKCIDELRAHIEHSADTYVDRLNEARRKNFAIAGVAFNANLDAIRYPHTVTTNKPSGTISKVMTCTEGAHLPAYSHYTRWVQYSEDDPELAKLSARGYPVKDVSASYPGHWVVGFPTELPIGKLMGQDFTAAGDATPEEQYRWLQLIEKYWLGPRGNQCSYCLAGDGRHLIVSSAGLQRIERFTSGEVPDRTGALQQTIDVVDNGVHETITVELDNGAEITGTSAHRVLTVNNDLDFVWKPLEEIAVDDVVVRRVGDNIWAANDASLPPKGPDRSDGNAGNVNTWHAPEKADATLGLFLGMLLSDGAILENGVCLVSATSDIAEQFAVLCETLFGLPAKIGRSRNLYQAIVNSRSLARWLLESVGVSRYHDDNRIPDCVLQSTAPVVRAFIKGYTLDGYVIARTGRIAVCTTVSSTMAKDLASVLWNLGFDASIGKKQGRPYWFSATNNGMGKDQYQVTLPPHEGERFLAEIGFLELHKTSAVRPASTPQAHKSSSIPAAKLQSILSNIPAKERPRALRHHLSKGSDRISVTLVKKYFADALVGHPVVADDTLRFTRVRSVHPGPEVATFDISVDVSHEYVANSVIVHNTLKYNPKKVSFEQFTDMVLKHQSKVRCCSVMAQDDDFSAYAYVPEERIDANKYAELMSNITSVVEAEGYDEEALACAGGACPIELNI